MASSGNRPDCAYYLLLGLSLGVFLGTIGGVLTYIAYWPDSALSHGHATHHHNNHKPPEQNLTHSHWNLPSAASEETLQNEERIEQRILSFEIIGPICIALGIFIAIMVGALALKFDCDHEPEPNIAFLRLKSELSLSFDLEKNRYELMTPLETNFTDAAAAGRSSQRDETSCY